MRLLIISNMPHHLREGQVVGWGPTVQEIDHLAEIFTEIRHIACLHGGPAPRNALPYASDRVRLRPVPPAGGTSLREKLAILGRFPQYARIILEELPQTDVVHVRCPANICLLATVMLAVQREPKLRWIKFATNWQPDGREAWSSTFQRWWLRQGWTRAWVTVNGECSGQPVHVRPFLNPCLTDAELEEAKVLAARKPAMYPLRLLFVGTLDSNKGVLRTLEIVRLVRSCGVDAQLEVVGDGPERPALERKIVELGMAAAVTLHGWLPRTVLGEIYARNHLYLMTSQTEGWPKVLSEAMAYGVVPIASAISCIPDYLKKFQVGRTVPWSDLPAFAEAALAYARAPGNWQAESARAMTAAAEFTYSSYLNEVRALLNLPTDAGKAEMGRKSTKKQLEMQGRFKEKFRK
jgi:glycosyltransferase involved in cell wall biosynthesis